MDMPEHALQYFARDFGHTAFSSLPERKFGPNLRILKN